MILGIWSGLQPGPLFYYLLNRPEDVKQWSRMRKILLVQIPGILLALLALVLFQIVPNYIVSLITLAGGIFLIYLAYSRSQPITSRNSPAEEKRKIAWKQNSTLKKAMMNELVRPAFYLYPLLIDAPLLLHLGSRSMIYFSPFLFFFTKIITESFVFRVSLVFHERFLSQKKPVHELQKKTSFWKRLFFLFNIRRKKETNEPAYDSGIFLFVHQIMNITLFIIGLFFIYFATSYLF
ncbi:MAG: hypothetical protein Q4G69_06095 [Planctomycetia bacterium]|nr:hypothetical protein [Planctomycetia bacterium]